MISGPRSGPGFSVGMTMAGWRAGRPDALQACAVRPGPTPGRYRRGSRRAADDGEGEGEAAAALQRLARPVSAISEAMTPAVPAAGSAAGVTPVSHPCRAEETSWELGTPAAGAFTEALRAGLCVTPTIRPSLLSSIECRKIAANHPKRPEPTGAPGFTEVRRQRQPL